MFRSNLISLVCLIIVSTASRVHGIGVGKNISKRYGKNTHTVISLVALNFLLGDLKKFQKLNFML